MFHGWNHLRPEDRDAILRGIEDGGVHGGPYHLELDWVDKCNARCFFCNSEFLHNGKSIAWPRAEQILAEARDNGLRSMRLAGGGEPSLHPHFADLLRFMADNGIVLDNLTTNGTQLTASVLEQLTRVPIRDVKISLNYATPETYAEGMGLPAKFFDRVLGMVRELNTVRPRNPNFQRLHIQFMVHRPTVDHIERMYALGRELQADLITFCELYGIAPERNYTAEDVPAITEQFRRVIREDWAEGRVENHVYSRGVKEAIARVYDELEQEIGTPRPGTAMPTIDESNRYCYIAWYSLTLNGTHSVYPCCYLMAKDTQKPIENLMEKSLMDVWRGEQMARFRAEMRRYFILGDKPAYGPGPELTDGSCWSHTLCPMTTWMCDDAFYEEAERRLIRVRNQPANLATRAAHGAVRTAKGIVRRG